MDLWIGGLVDWWIGGALDKRETCCFAYKTFFFFWRSGYRPRRWILKSQLHNTREKTHKELKQKKFERRGSTGIEVFFILKQMGATKFAFLSAFTIIETIRLKIWAKLPSTNEKIPLPVEVRRS